MSDSKRAEFDSVLNWIRSRFGEDYTVEQVTAPEYDGGSFIFVLKTKDGSGRTLAVPVKPSEVG